MIVAKPDIEKEDMNAAAAIILIEFIDKSLLSNCMHIHKLEHA